MSEHNDIWFEKLTKDREESALMLEKPSMSGIKKSVVEKYSDQAHFVYELLQNANDVKATYSSFELKRNGLYFKHNGKISFSVSNPLTEAEDKEIGKLGHINSITAIANSNKTEASIGKFGVGFKSVFQYTDTPHIYDPGFKFKIERFIVPKKLNEDIIGINEQETVFWFPFDKKETSPEKAFSEILEKLKKIIYPTLFLTNLLEVRWNSDNNESGNYTKKIIFRKTSNNIEYQNIELHNENGYGKIKERLYLFNRTITEQNLQYSVGYFTDDNCKLIPKSMPAFCFFPTKETTHLNFILHAPFLLTDSREGIKRFENYNIELINELSILAADSMLILRNLKLIDNDIIKIIPYKEYENDDLFSIFHDRIKAKFLNEDLLPTQDTHTNKLNAYWAQDNSVLNLFSDEQLSYLIYNEDAKWVFRNLVRNQTGKDEDLRNYIDDCTISYYDINSLLYRIRAGFIENQSYEWLHKFYEFLQKNSSYWNDLKTKPIFLNIEGKAVPAFELRGKTYHEILFLPSDNLENTNKTISPRLLDNKISLDFFNSFGIKKPNIKDEIYNHILPQYDTEDVKDSEKHFQIFFTLWKEEGRPEDLINLIKSKAFISYYSENGKSIGYCKASDSYYPSEKLIIYFQTKPNTKFVHIDKYEKLFNAPNDKQLLKEFLLKLGINELPVLISEQILDRNEIEKIIDRKGNSLSQGTKGYSNQGTFQKKIDGCEELLNQIKNSSDIHKSKILWNVICEIQDNKYDLLIDYYGKHLYVYYKNYYQLFETFELKRLKNETWLIDKNGQFVKPCDISLNDLAEGYNINSSKINEIEKLLLLKPSIVLSETEKILQKFESEEEAEEARKALEEKREREKRKAERQKSGFNTEVDSIVLTGVIESLGNLSESVSKPRIEKEKTNVLSDFDENEELAKGIDDLKKQLEIKKSRVDIAGTINTCIKYSYDWFKAYLKLLTTYGEKENTIKQRSISFQTIKPYKSDNKYFILCGSDNYISPEIENAVDIKVSLDFKSGKKENIIVEGLSKKGQDLLIYCPDGLPTSTLKNINNVFKVEIKFTPVINLLDRLYKAYTNKDYLDGWINIEDSIPNLNYIYGPPGTGKTTTLCTNINGILNSHRDAKFLILTPTNKAADVVCKKLLEINSDLSIVRISSPTDPDLESSGIYSDTIDSDKISNLNIVASTIHRLPYFEIQNEGLFLFQYKWDYVIFDESSMIGLHYITFAIMSLFKSNHNTIFTIAGDPKQIPPVIEIDDNELEAFDFQDENVYKMMKLDSFNPKEQKIRAIDKIENLNTQYRSIPEIGQLFSEFSYSSLLNHHRKKTEKKKLIPEKLKFLIGQNVSFVDIPLNQENSLFKVSKLYHSPYQIYSSLLVAEVIKYFDSNNIEENWTIGIISPYKAQAVLLNKLLASYNISEKIKVYSDTVHGFQGDECDIVFFVCNPNNYFYTGHEKSLLSKEYIYNVAISRAKDYLVILHPYSIIRNNPFINKIGISYRENFGNAKIIAAQEIEKQIFSDTNYIINNTYNSGHDNVNVFGLSQMKYFIKSNDSAIDIQIRDLSEKK